MLKHSLIAVAALGVGLSGLTATQASAFTVTKPAVEAGNSALMTDVRSRHGNDRYSGNNHYTRYDRSRHGDRCGSWSNHCRYRHGGYYYQNPWWLLPMVGAGIAIGAAGAYDGYDGYGSRHVEWCLDHYRSYNPRSNTWVSYSGAVRQCISPYGP